MAAAASAGASANIAGLGWEIEQVLCRVLPPVDVEELRKLLEGRLFELARDPRPLLALHEGSFPVEGATSAVLSIHYCLAAGWIVAQGENRPELEPFLAELQRMDGGGVFLSRELGHGDDLDSLETEAVYLPEAREFVLTSPHPRAYKVMPNLGSAVPKLAVVMARLTSLGKDCGVFPFIVPIRDPDGSLRQGMRIAPVTEQAHALDNAVMRFEGVRIPKAHLLAGSDSLLRENGSFVTTAGRADRAVRVA